MEKLIFCLFDFLFSRRFCFIFPPRPESFRINCFLPEISRHDRKVYAITEKFTDFCAQSILRTKLYKILVNKPFFDYKKLEIYHLSQQFVLDIYTIVKNFPDCESNNLVSQITRAATSIPLNIAEGSAAGSYKIFLNYVIFAYRSANEVEAALETSKRLTYLDEQTYYVILEKLNKLIRKIYRYMEYLDKNAGDRKWDKSSYYRQQKYYVDNEMKQ